jgi:hypothetical protein
MIVVPKVLAALLLTGAIIDWDAPEGCPDAVAVAANVERFLGTEVPSTAEVTGSARVARDGKGFEMTFELTSPSGRTEKQLSSAKCEVLADAFALELALALDTLAVVAALPEPPAPIEVEPPLEPAAVPEPAPTRPRSRRPAFALSVRGGASLGVVPGVGGRLQLDLALVWRLARLSLAGGYDLPKPARATDDEDVGIDVSLGSVELRACAVPRLRTVELPICGALEGGAMRADPVGLADPQVSHRAFLAGLFGSGVGVPVHRIVVLWLTVDAVVPILRPGFEAGGFGTLYRVPPVGARALLGIEVRLSKRRGGQ